MYRTGDERFRVEKSDVGWYLVDNEHANEFGQQLIRGPLPTLDAVRDQIPGARDIKPQLRVRPGKVKTARKEAAKGERPAPPPVSWIDRLPDKEATHVRRLIRALEHEGVSDAEDLVRRHRDDPMPVIATRIVEQRLRALVDEQPEPDREREQALVRRVAQILALSGVTVEPPAARWALVEVHDGDELPRANQTLD